MKRLWVHETMRVYYDRLVDDSDKTNLFQQILKVTQKCMNKDLKDLFPSLVEETEVTEDRMRSFLFCDFLDPTMEEKFYRENTDMQVLRDSVSSQLAEYNKTSRKPMDLVLFNFALEHLFKINRVLKQSQSSALLIGVGGSGRQSLTRLAAHISNYSFHMIEMNNTYSFIDWRSDIKAVLRKFSGNKSRCSVSVQQSAKRS